jgi:predicted amidohydrolase
MKVVVAQIGQVNDPAKNTKKILSVLEKVQGDIVCFPETSLSGELKDLDFSPYHQLIAQKVKEKKIWCIYGSYAKRDGRIFNETYLLNPNGEIVFIHRKRHLWVIEKGSVTPGVDESRVIDIGMAKIGIINCWDIAFPEESRALARKGADVIFCPAYWMDTECEFVEILPRARAFENQIFFIFCDAATSETASRSIVCSPVDVVAQAKPGEEVFGVDLDISKTKSWRKLYDCRI